MSHVVKSALVPFSAAQMYALVADVDGYRDFLPWCRDSAVVSRSENELIGRIDVAKGPIHKTFSTRNRLRQDERIDIDLVDGPFRRLDGHWRFEALEEAACKVSLDLEFEFANRLLAGAFAPLFKEVAEAMLDAFVKRAHQVHGGR